jgi:hypothetical protein
VVIPSPSQPTGEATRSAMSNASTILRMFFILWLLDIDLPSGLSVIR